MSGDEFGTVVNVATTNVGEFLTADVAAGVAVLPVSNVTTFDEKGGQVTILGVVYSYWGIDVDNSWLLLNTSSGLLLALAGTGGIRAPILAEERVEIYPPRPEKKALVDFGVEEGEAVFAIVPQTLNGVIQDGFREEGFRETVLVRERTVGELYVEDMVAQPPDIEVEVTLGDGVPPIASPTPVVTGWVGALHAKWAPIINSELPQYDVHVSSTNGFLTDDATTLVGTTTATSMTIRSLPNDLLLVYGTTYYVRIVARDSDGAAPAGGQASAQMQPVTGPDIAATYVYAGSVSASQIEGGEISGDIVYGGKLSTRSTNSGPGVDQDASGITIYDLSGIPTTDLNTDATSVFRGDAEIGGLTVTDAMSIRGTANELSTGGELDLASGITAPSTGPSVVQDWESIQFTKAGDGTFNAANITSVQWNSSLWICGYRDGSFYRVYAFNSDGTFNSEAADKVLSSTALQTTQIGVGGYCFSVASNNTIYRHRKLTSTWTLQDDFPSSIDGATWVDTNNAVWDSGSGGRAKLTGDSHIMTSATYDFKSAAVQVKILRSSGTSGQDIFLTLREGVSGNELAQIKLDGSSLIFRVYTGAVDGTVEFESSITYSASNHAYWKIWEEDTIGGGGNFHYATSPDGVTWTEREVFDHDFTVGEMDGNEIRFTGQDSGLVFYIDEFKYGPANEGISSAVYDTQNSDGDPMTIGNDGTNIFLAEHDNIGNDRLRVRVINPVGWDVLSTFNSADTTIYDGPLAGILWGSFDFGANRYVFKRVDSTSEWYSVNSSTGADVSGERFPADSGGSRSITWDGSFFWALGTNGSIYKHTANLQSGSYLAGFTWFDSAGTTHETTISPLSNFTLKKRARITLTAAQIPGAGGVDDPNCVRFYAGTSSGAMKLQSTTGVGIYSAIYQTITTGGAAPPGSGNFVAGVPATIRSSGGTLVISGDGTISGGVFSGSFAGTVTPTPTEIGNAVDLDSITTPGVYSQTSDAEAAAGTNYPVPYAGFLEVQAVGSTIRSQTYTAHRNADLAGVPSIWRRTFISAVWSAWVPIFDDHGTDSTVSNIIVAASGWTITSANARLQGKVLALRLGTITKTGSLLAVGADGNVANTAVGTLTAKYRPGVGFDQGGLLTGATGRGASFVVSTAGVVSVTWIDSGSDPAAGIDLAVNDVLSALGTIIMA